MCSRAATLGSGRSGAAQEPEPADALSPPLLVHALTMMGPGPRPAAA